MKRNRSWQNNWVVLAICALGLALPSSGSAGLIYRQTFDDGDGVPEVTPGAGVLGVDPAGGNGDAAFDGSGGVFGGVLNLSSGTNVDTAAIAGTTAPAVGGSNIENIGTLNEVTVTMWVNIQGFRTDVRNRFTNVIVLGDTPTNFSTPNGLGIALGTNRTAATATTGPREMNVYVKGSTAAPLDFESNPSGIDGFALTAGEWTFMALTYDGSSTLANDSAIQLAATGGLSSLNGQVYKGTQTTPVTRFEAAFTNPPPAGNNAAANPAGNSAGPIAFSTSTGLFLGNSNALTRGIDGFIDDVQVFDRVLSANDIDAIRQLGPQGVTIPEPSTLVLTSLLFAALVLADRRRAGCGSRN